MTPHSPGADQIDTLFWIGFVVATIVVVAINVALLYAVRKYRSERGAEPRQVTGGRKLQFRVGADEEGAFEGASATLSGQAYAAMRTEVEVVSPEAYESFLEQQKSDIEAAQDRVVGLIENGEVP